MTKIRLTDDKVQKLPPAPPGKRMRIYDAEMPGLLVQVTASGSKSFMLYTRFPAGDRLVPARRLLGTVGKMSIKDARQKALDWYKLIDQGIDPEVEEERLRREAQQQRDNTFGVVVEDYIKHELSKQRRGEGVVRRLRKKFVPEWGARPVTEITRSDVTWFIREIASKHGKYEAHGAFANCRAFFNWAINADLYGLPDYSPCDRIKPAKIIGKKEPRQRRLSEDEIFAYWRAALRSDYPFGPFFRLLMLTGQRRAEVSGARWREFHPELVRLLRNREEGQSIDWRTVPADIKLWTVGAKRFKSEADHMVPLSDEACELLASLPRFRKDHVFSTTGGEKAIFGFSKEKRKLEVRMLRTLRALARRRGEDPAEVEMERWVIHDLRRVVRSELARLRVPDEVAEMVIGHGKKGLQRVYDQHRYVDEMREALEGWATRLQAIVEPTPQADNVVELRVG